MWLMIQWRWSVLTIKKLYKMCSGAVGGLVTVTVYIQIHLDVQKHRTD